MGRRIGSREIVMDSITDLKMSIGNIYKIIFWNGEEAIKLLCTDKLDTFGSTYK